MASAGDLEKQPPVDGGATSPKNGHAAPPRNGEGGSSEDRIQTVIAYIVGFGVLLLIVISTFLGTFGIGVDHLEIIASAELDAAQARGTNGAGKLSLSGRVLFNGEPPAATTIWAIIADDRGNRFAPPAIKNAPLGEFNIAGIPTILSGTNKPKFLEATIFAKGTVDKEKNGKLETVPIKGKQLLTLGEQGGIRWIALPMWAVLPLLGVFMGSIMFALIPFSAGSTGIKAKYYACVTGALLLTVGMIFCISLGLYKINLMETKDVISLGIANIFHGTYQKDIQPEWLLSLTAPQPTAIGSSVVDVVHGFGAPLWVLLVSVFGGGAFTLMLLIRGIQDPADFDSPREVNKRLEDIVSHQFYIIFSPIGAAFVYQLMVSAGMTAQPVTVAIVSLAAGLGLNLLLNKALEMLKRLISGDKQETEEELKEKKELQPALDEATMRGKVVGAVAEAGVGK